MGLAEWFNTFCSNIRIQNSGTISNRYRAITRRLNSDFRNTNSETSHSLYVGSYGRNTAIAGFSDLDMIFELPSSLYYQYDNHIGNGQSALLQEVRNSMQKTYPNSSIGGDGQVVAARFQDGITFEVVPVFLNRDRSYTYPNSKSGGSWKITNPRPEIEAIRTRNDVCNGNLISLSRMMRAWKRKWNVPIGGLLIDTLAYQFIIDWEYKDKSYFYYDLMCRDFFRFMKNQDTKIKLTGKPLGVVNTFTERDLFQWKATRCYNISLEAIEHESASPKREWSAKKKWREDLWNLIPVANDVS